MTDFLKDYASRSAAADAIRSVEIPGGSVFAADGRLFRYGNRGTAFDDLGVAGVQPVGVVEMDHFGDTDNDRVTRSIEALNAGEVSNLYGSGNTYNIDVTPPEITAHNFEIEGRQSMIRTSASDARVFRVGSGENFVRRSVIRDFQIGALDHNATGACIEVENATDVLFENIDPVNVPQYLHIGGAAKSATVVVRGARGSWRSASDLSPVFLEAGAVVKLFDIDIFSPDPAPSARSILVRPKHIMDTLEIMRCKIYAGKGIGGGLDVDLTDFPVTNVWAGGNTFDRCVEGCFIFRARGDKNNWFKHLRIFENYARCTGGFVVDLQNLGGRADMDIMAIYHNNLGAIGDGCIRAMNAGLGGNMRGLLVSGNSLNDDSQYVTAVTREEQAVITFSTLNGFAVGDYIRLDNFFRSLHFINGRNVRVLEVMPDLRSVRVNLNTTSIDPTDSQNGAATKMRDAMLHVGLPATRVTDNMFGRRVDSTPQGATKAAIKRLTEDTVKESDNDLLSVEHLFL